MLDHIRGSDVWLQQDNINVDIHVIKLRLIDMCKQNWYSNINNLIRIFTAILNTNLLEKYFSVIKKTFIK